MAQQQLDLNPMQIQQAAAAGVQLLNTPGAVSVPGQIAVTGIIGTLNALLAAIANRELMVVQFPTAPPMEIPPEGNGEKLPQLTPVEEGGKKKAEK